jgi:hypothetical protein
MGQASFATGLKGPAKGMLSAMEGGVVGGLSNVAMGGDFWHGFTEGFESAGLSFAVNDVVKEMEVDQESTITKTKLENPDKALPKKATGEEGATLKNPSIQAEIKKSAEETGLTDKKVAADPTTHEPIGRLEHSVVAHCCPKQSHNEITG